MYQKGRAWIELNQNNLEHNLGEIKKLIPEGTSMMAAVKANAYGHGAVECARVLQEQGVESFCVAALAEGIELRQSGIKGEILILGYTHPDQIEDAVRYDLTQTIVDADYGRKLGELLGAADKTLKSHIGIDTGMHRIGEWYEKTQDILVLWNYPSLNITGIYSHLCVSDSLEPSHREYTRKQAERFQSLLKALDQAGIKDRKVHLLSSYGLLNYPEYAYDYTRIGIALYGILSSPQDTTLLTPDLKPVLSLKTRIQSVRELQEGESAGYGLTFTADCSRKIAALSIGYADGIPRSLSNTGYVLIHGIKAPVIGRICMDQMTVDITGIPMAQPGDEAVLIGKSGQEEITAPVFAQWNQTISNEVLSRLGSRLERVVQAVWTKQETEPEQDTEEKNPLRAVELCVCPSLRSVG